MLCFEVVLANILKLEISFVLYTCVFESTRYLALTVIAHYDIEALHGITKLTVSVATWFELKILTNLTANNVDFIDQ